ncbi:MAG: Ldh family oxidoreductase [Planctomycetes bacterium]|nr:Ldh family oxidoreductase [Planctomycetota bacterium]
MNARRISADSLRPFVEQVFLRIGYPREQATDAADVLMWASLRGVDTHGVRNLKSYYVDHTLEGVLRPQSQPRVEHQTPQTACLDGDSGLGLACACRAMRVAIDKSRSTGVGIVCVRNTHHLGPAGYFAHMAVEHGMLGLCMTGHFFGKGHSIGIAPLGSFLPMFSTNPLSFAAPCGRHAPFVLDMSTSIATVNRIEMHAQEGRSIPAGWACDADGNPTTNPAAARIMLPLGGTAELGGYKGAGLAMMVSILSGVLSGAWASVERTGKGDSHLLPERPDGCSAQKVAVTFSGESGPYDQATMGHFFAAVQIDAFQPLDRFRGAMDAMIDALHAAPLANPNDKVCYPGEIEAAAAAERMKHGIPINDRLFSELEKLAEQIGIGMPQA